jgi:hypothetical protein
MRDDPGTMTILTPSTPSGLKGSQVAIPARARWLPSGIAFVTALTVGCATGPAIKTAADRRACDEVIAAVKQTWKTGGSSLSSEAARFASERGLGPNLFANKSGGYDFVPRLIPFELLAAADVDPDASPIQTQYRIFLSGRTPAQRAALAEEGRRCEW